MSQQYLYIRVRDGPSDAMSSEVRYGHCEDMDFPKESAT